MINYDDYFSGYDSSLRCVYDASWQTEEEHGWIFIFKKDNKYYSIEGGYCVMQEFPYEYNWKDDHVLISEDEALDLIDEWEIRLNYFR